MTQNNHIEIGLMISIILCFLGLVTFYVKTQSAAKKDGKDWGTEWGALTTNIQNIKENIAEIKVSVGENSKNMMAAIEKEENNRKDSIRRLYERLDERLDEHVKTHHNIS